MSKVDKALISIIGYVLRATKRNRNGVCKTEPSENMRCLWELHPDLDREAIRDEQRRQLG